MTRVVILDNLRSAWNVGSIFRTAAALAFDEVALCGVTMTPPSKKLHETSRGTEDQQPWRSFPSTVEALEHYGKAGFSLVALDTAPQAEAFVEHRWPEKVAIVLGNEAKGIDHRALELCDHVVELPMLNDRSGINVSCAFAAAAYANLLRQPHRP